MGQAWLVLEITGPPLQLGGVTALQFAPVPVLSPIGGALSGRYPQRRIIRWAQVMMPRLFALAGLVWSGACDRIWTPRARACERSARSQG